VWSLYPKFFGFLMEKITGVCGNEIKHKMWENDE
jgi:hypothetical protein